MMTLQCLERFKMTLTRKRCSPRPTEAALASTGLNGTCRKAFEAKHGEDSLNLEEIGKRLMALVVSDPEQPHLGKFLRASKAYEPGAPPFDQIF